jgi:hypothetical protein
VASLSVEKVERNQLFTHFPFLFLTVDPSFSIFFSPP